MFPIKDNIPSSHIPVVTKLLVVINAIVFILTLMLTQEGLTRVFYLFGVVPVRFTHPFYSQLVGYPEHGILPFITSMFLHGGFFHFLSNMWTLWIFGDNVEDKMGPVRFLLFYLFCGIISMLTHTLTNPTSNIPAIGASGAIAGVMGAYMILFPRSMVITLIPILFIPYFIPLPSFIYLLVWFFSQFLSGTLSLANPGQGGGIAWWAHIGGFIAGALFYGWFLSPARLKEEERSRQWQQIEDYD